MYLEIDEGFPGHRKTIRLCSALKNPEAAWYVIRLWTWACRSCPTGDLTGMGAYDLEIAVQYRPLDGACYAAMVAAGFIDEVDGQPASIHNWMSRTGAAIHRMDAAAARKKTYRAHKDGRCGGDCQFCTPGETSTDCPQDIPAPGDGRFNTDKTRPVQSSDLSLSSPSDPQKPPERAIPVVQAAAATQAVTGPWLAGLFGRIRAELVGGLEWQGSGASAESASTKAAIVASMAGASGSVEPSMRKFWTAVKAGTHPKGAECARKPSFAFGCWWTDFQGDHEEAVGCGAVATSARGSPGAPAQPAYPDLTKTKLFRQGTP